MLVAFFEVIAVAWFYGMYLDFIRVEFPENLKNVGQAFLTGKFENFVQNLRTLKWALS